MGVVTDLVRHNLCDETVARHEAGHAVVAVASGWGVGKISAIRRGNVAGFAEITPPQGKSFLLLRIEEITIRLAGRVACLVGDDSADIKLARSLASDVVRSDAEGQALLNYAIERATSILRSENGEKAIGVLAQRLKDSGGEFDLNHQPVRDMQPLINVEQPNIVINLPPQPAPIVNVSLPEQPPPTVVVEAPDKVVSFSRNDDGEIVEAVTETVAA